MLKSSFIGSFLFTSLSFALPAVAGDLILANGPGADSNFVLKGTVEKRVRHNSKGMKDGADARSGKQEAKSLEGNISVVAEKEENSIIWDRWRNKVHRAIWARFCRLLAGGDAFMLGNTVFKLGDAAKPSFPLGTRASYVCTVSRDRNLLEAKITKSSGNQEFDELVLKSVRSIREKGLLRFPEGTKRESVTLSATMFTTKNGNYEDKQFNDVEKIVLDSK